MTKMQTPPWGDPWACAPEAYIETAARRLLFTDNFGIRIVGKIGQRIKAIFCLQK